MTRGVNHAQGDKRFLDLSGARATAKISATRSTTSTRFDTPVMSAIRRRNVKNRTFDWQTEFLPTVNPNNAQAEGFVLSNNPAHADDPAAATSLRFPSATRRCQARRRRADAAGKGAKWRTRWRWPRRCSSPTWRRSCADASRASMRPAATSRRRAPPRRSRTGSARAKDKTGAVAGAIAPGTSVAALPVLPTDAFRRRRPPSSSPRRCSATRCRRLTPTGRAPRCGWCLPGPRGRSRPSSADRRPRCWWAKLKSSRRSM